MQRSPDGVKLSAIDLNLLVALDALLRDGSVTAAGRRIGLSQPAMSHALSRLRELLGDPLLIRSGGGMRHTELAAHLAPRVRRLAGEIEATLLGRTTFDPATATRILRVATNDYCGAILMPAVLARLQRAAPGVELELHAHRGPAPYDALTRGELDLAIGVFLELDAGLARESLFDERFVCVVRAGHPSVGGALTLPQFLELGHVLVSAPDYGPGVVDLALKERGLYRHVVARVPSFLVAPALVARTDLVATLPERVAHLVAGGHGLRVLPTPLEVPSFQVQAVWQTSTADAAVSWLRGEVRAVAKKLSSSTARMPAFDASIGRKRKPGPG